MILKKASTYGPPKKVEYDANVWVDATVQFDEWKKCFITTDPVKTHVSGNMYFISSLWE